MAKVFDFLHATTDVLVDRGIQLPLKGQSTTTPQTAWDIAGQDNCCLVAGPCAGVGSVG